MTAHENSKWDFSVVGGGIAGLAIAEMLQRSGASVLLLEKNLKLCGGASAEQQGWFHTGALYAALPQNFSFRAMVGNLDDLVDYYHEFPNMNLRIDKHISTTGREGWFSNRTNFYLYSSVRAVSWAWKLPWMLALYRAKQRMSWFENLDSSRSLSRQTGLAAKPTKYVIHGAGLGLNFESLAFALKSRDRTMNTRLITEDLLRSYLANGGVLQTGAEVVDVDHGIVHAKSGDGQTPSRFRARHVIVAAGRDAAFFDRNARVVMSPLLVVYPALTDVNFVKMSPHMQETINHIYHRADGLEYSLLGNAVYYDPRKGTGQPDHEARAHMMETAQKIFGDFSPSKSAMYFGYKTEITGASFLRNYLYHIIDRGRFTLVLPGKFSLCFSLAVNVCRHFGIEPVEQVRLKQDEPVGHLIEDPLHYQLAKQLAATRESA